MSRVMRMSDRAYEMLQALATPFEDSPSDVVERIAQAELERRGIRPPRNGNGEHPDPSTLKLDPTDPDDLRHTRVRRARINDREISKPNWWKLLTLMHCIALEELSTFEDLLSASEANLRQGRYEESGFKYVPEGNISLQGQDANDSWHTILRLARRVGSSIDLDLEWHNKPKAAHPGQRGSLTWHRGNGRN